MAQNLITRFSRQTGSSLVTVPYGLSFEMVSSQQAQKTASNSKKLLAPRSLVEAKI
jgi:hypothetical protein